MKLLRHKFPKYSWNVAYILENLVHETTNTQDDGTVRGELMKLIFESSPELIELFLTTPNLKLKLSLSDLLTEETIYNQFTLKQAVDLFDFFCKLKTGDWEQENLPRFGEISAIQELKNRSFSIALNLMEKFFTDENFRS